MGHVPTAHRSPTAPKERDWDWSDTNKFDQILDHGGWDAVANAHAWYDPDADENDPPQQRTAYKLPHHELLDGRLQVVRRGVVAAMTVVKGARSGLDIPERDRRLVYNHLAEHYREFDEEPPGYS